MSSKAKPLSFTDASHPKAKRNVTPAFPPRPVRSCEAVTQPPEPFPVEFLPDQPCDCPPGLPLIVLSLNQLFGSPKAPTVCQVVPPSIDD